MGGPPLPRERLTEDSCDVLIFFFFPLHTYRLPRAWVETSGRTRAPLGRWAGPTRTEAAAAAAPAAETARTTAPTLTSRTLRFQCPSPLDREHPCVTKRSLTSPSLVSLLLKQFLRVTDGGGRGRGTVLLRVTNFRTR